MERLHWPNRWVFILAAIGSAAGLGNVWRFPFLAFEHGGGAFIIAIIVANLVVGIPILLLEIGLGQKEQRGAPDAFAAVKKGFGVIGWLGIVLMFLIMAYYMGVMAWSVDYLGTAFNLGWGADTAGFFFNNILKLSDGPGTLGSVSIPALIGFIIAWTAVYFSIWKGVKSISKVVVWTATLPYIILLILLVRAVTLPGAGAGLSLYLIPHWASLLNHKLWLAAFSQVFFSLSVAMGMMIAYGSFNNPKTEITKSALWIAGGNFLVSFMAGFVVFGTLGYMATQQGVAVADVVAGGPSLVFVTYPAALSLMPVAPVLFALLFFGTIVLLAIDSAFSIIEGVAIGFKDRFPAIKTEKITLWITLVTMLAGIPFLTGAGLYYLDILDHFVVNYGIVFVGFLEALVVGWIWKGDVLRTYINNVSGWKLGNAWKFTIKYLTPLFLLVLFVTNLIDEFRTPYEDYPIWALIWIGAVPVVLAPVIAYILNKVTQQGPAAPAVASSEQQDS